MRKAAITGGLTGIGTVLAIIAVYRGVRLDWTETALVAGIAFLTAGVLGIKEMVEEICGKE